MEIEGGFTTPSKAFTRTNQKIAKGEKPMEFIEMSGKKLLDVLTDSELSSEELETIGVTDFCVVRINRQGDIELRRPTSWDVIGGLLGNFEERIKKRTGLDWVKPSV